MEKKFVKYESPEMAEVSVTVEKGFALSGEDFLPIVPGGEWDKSL